jgi:hypothetical protein
MFTTRHLWVGAFGTFASLIVGSTSCASAPDGNAEAIGASAEAITGAVGDWTGFTNGECVHGVYEFYSHRYGVTLTGTCAQPADVGNCETCGACMIWEGSRVEPSATLFNRHAWGATTPQTYDIVVYPPRTSAVGPGHVACVDHMTSSDPSDWQALYVMDTNYYGGETMATAVHTVSRAPYGIYRLKSLEAPADATPRGYLDSATCTSVAGWTQDPTSPTASIFADLYFDGAAGSPNAKGIRLSADDSRSDLCTAIGSCDHGFSMSTPRGTMDGAAHSVYAYGIDTTGGTNPLLSDAPKSVTCTAPAIGPKEIKRALPDAASLASWSFSTFFDMAPYTTAELAAVKSGPALEATPKLVQVPGQADIFVVDGSARRKVVDMTSFGAWRFTTASVEAVDVVKLATWTEGIDWPTTPLLVKDPTAATVYLLDTAEPDANEVAPTRTTFADAGGREGGGFPTNGDSGASSGCSASAPSPRGQAWLFVPFAAIAVARRRRRFNPRRASASARG